MLSCISKPLERLSIILASQSPRRQAMLRENLNIKFEVVASGFEENIDKNICKGPEDYVSRTSKMKAEAVVNTLLSNNRFEDIIISADTIVVCDNTILEKPSDESSARMMLSMLSGRHHNVMTGVTIAYKKRLYDAVAGSKENKMILSSDYSYYEFVESTEVKFAKLDDNIINAYVATGEPMDKAGSYGIQGIGASLVEGINGCYFNVVGFPLHRAYSDH